MLRLDIECDVNAQLDVAWRRASVPTYTRADRASITISAGRATRFLEIPLPAGPCRLLLRAAERGVRFTLHAFDVRASDAR
jgi:hypothetical protein